MKLDHLVIAGNTLEEASDYIASSLGVALQEGGKHSHFGTHNSLLGLGNKVYLEAIAIDPDAIHPITPRWFDLNNFQGPPKLKNWVCRCKDIEKELNNLPKQDNYIVELERSYFKWLMSVPKNGILMFDEMVPALIQWKSAVCPPKLLEESFCRLKRLTITHPLALTLNEHLKCLEDKRVRFEKANNIALFAEIKTPHGIRYLE